MKTGNRYNKLVAIKFVRRDKHYNHYWLFQCDCGNKKVMNISNVTREISKSCGCLSRELAGKRNSTHKMSSTKEYNIWGQMKKRCFNKNNRAYKDYGGRGIKLCKRWLKFENFYKDMGDRPKNKTLDRINNDGDYKPSNCRWASWKEQQSNRRDNIPVSVNGVKISLPDLAEMFDLRYDTLYARLFYYNWDLKKSLTTKICQ